MKSKKLDKTDIESITNVQGQFTECTNSLGLLQIDEKTLSNQLLMIEEKKNEIFNKFDELRKQEQELVQSLQEKYGQGQINLQACDFKSTISVLFSEHTTISLEKYLKTVLHMLHITTYHMKTHTYLPTKYLICTKHTITH